MPFSLHPTVTATLGQILGPTPPPPLPAGDVEGRRERMGGFFNFVSSALPTVSDVETKDFRAASEDGHSVPCRWFVKSGSKQAAPGPAVLYIHGGGMIALGLEHYDNVIKYYVSVTNVPFLAVEYRLAPESKAPWLVKDAYAGLRYLHDNAASLGVDPTRIAVMGDSAGGGIAAALTHYIKLRGGPAVSRQILIYPMLDDRTDKADDDVAPFLAWTVDDNLTGWNSLLGDRRGKADVSAIEAPGRMTTQDARGLPPAYIDVGELDLFREEDLEYAKTLGRAGVSCEVHVYPDVFHAWEGLALDSDVTKLALGQRAKAILSV